jgi:hypothetical protein
VAASLILSLPLGLAFGLCGYPHLVLRDGAAQLAETRLDRLLALFYDICDLRLHGVQAGRVVHHVCGVLPECLVKGSPHELEPGDLFLREVFLVPHKGEEVETDFGGLIAGDALLDLVASQVEPGLICARAIADRALLQTVQLIQLTIERYIADKMEGILLLAGVLGVFDLEWVLPMEAVVREPDDLRVAYGPSAVLPIQHHSEILEVLQLISDLQVFCLVQQDREQGIGRAGIVNDLVGKEELGVVVGQGLSLLCPWGVLHPFEEEDQPVDGSSRVNEREIT